MAQFIPSELPRDALAAEHVLFNKLRELPDAFLFFVSSHAILTILISFWPTML